MLVDEGVVPEDADACVDAAELGFQDFDITKEGFVVRELFGDNTIAGLSDLIGLHLTPTEDH